MDQRILERIAQQDGPLQSLTREELELERAPFTRDPRRPPADDAGVFGRCSPCLSFGLHSDWAEAHLPRLLGALRFDGDLADRLNMASSPVRVNERSGLKSASAQSDPEVDSDDVRGRV